MEFIMSYSCGKDSTLALSRMIDKGFIPKALLITINQEENKSWFHEMSLDLIKKVSKALEIPLILSKSSGNNYEISFVKALEEGKKFGAKYCVFGDIDIEEHKKWCNDRCKEANINSIFPLWQEDREALTYEFIEKGFKAVIKKINKSYLSKSFLGEILTKDLISDIKKHGSDPCGENGEYHTFVFDGPIFKNSIDIKLGEVSENKNSAFIGIKA